MQNKSLSSFMPAHFLHRDVFSGDLQTLPTVEVKNKTRKMFCDICPHEEQLAASYCDECNEKLCPTHAEVWFSGQNVRFLTIR